MSANSRNSARVVLESSDISRALSRIAHEILENNKGSKDLVLLGIPSRGVPLANRIAQKINEFEKVQEIKKKTAAALEEIKEKFEAKTNELNYQNYTSLQQYIVSLSEIRSLRGEMISAKDLQYVDVNLIDNWENELSTLSTKLANDCVAFLLEPEALSPYQQTIDSISTEINTLSKTIQAKEIDKNLDEKLIHTKPGVGFIFTRLA